MSWIYSFLAGVGAGAILRFSYDMIQGWRRHRKIMRRLGW